MMFLVIATILLWLPLGALGVYMAAKAEKYGIIDSEGETGLLLAGPLAPFMVLVLVGLILAMKAAANGLDRFDSIAQFIKEMGKK